MAERRQWMKRESRSAKWLDASVRSKARAEAPAVITNISARGCRITSTAAFEIGELIQIMVPRLGVIAAHVRWCQGRDFGAEFVLGSDSWERVQGDFTGAGKEHLAHQENSKAG